MGFELYPQEQEYDSSEQAKNVEIKIGHTALFGKNDKI